MSQSELHPDREVDEVITDAMRLTTGNVEELADEVGVSRATLYAWASGRRQPGPEALVALAEALEARAIRIMAMSARLRFDADDGDGSAAIAGSSVAWARMIEELRGVVAADAREAQEVFGEEGEAGREG